MTERDIELPALPTLPRPDVYDPGRFGTAWGEVKLVEFAQTYARAAVLADRLRASEAIAEEARILRRKWLGHRDTDHLSLTEAADQVIGGLHAQIASASEAAGWRSVMAELLWAYESQIPNAEQGKAAQYAWGVRCTAARDAAAAMLTASPTLGTEGETL